MTQDHRLQLQRFELKYLIPERSTPAIRDFLQSWLEIDEYGAGRPDLSYPVHSLYLDSDDLRTYHTSVNGTKNRFKLRLRYYDALPESPVFFEIKRRMNNCILKQRGPVRRKAVPGLLAGQLPEAKDVLSGDPRHRVAVQQFCLLMQQIQAKPKAHNHYRREAWVSPHNNSIRVTIDRGMCLEPHFESGVSTRMRQPERTFGAEVILELKFAERFPTWLRDLAQRFNLMQFAAPKYVAGVMRLGEHRFRNRNLPASPVGPRLPAGDDALGSVAPVERASERRIPRAAVTATARIFHRKAAAER